MGQRIPSVQTKRRVKVLASDQHETVEAMANSFLDGLPEAVAADAEIKFAASYGEASDLFAVLIDYSEVLK